MIIVTGAAGFIGSNIVADLEEAGMGPIVAVDWFGTEDKWRNLAKHALYAYVRPEDAFEYMESHRTDISAVVHMGAISATTEQDADLLVERNINYTLRLWDYCARYDKQFIYASSAATYGAKETGFNDLQDLDYLRALRPLNKYGWSKNATDMAIALKIRAGEKTPHQWAGLKFFNVYGPNEYHKGSMMSVIAKFFKPLSEGREIGLFKSYRPDVADGEQRRDFVYVKDCARAIRWLLGNGQVSGLFNIGTGKARSFLDVIHAMGDALGIQPKIKFVPMPDSIRDKYQYFTQADMGKIQKVAPELKFMTLEDGVGEYVKKYLSQTDEYC